MIKYKHYLEIFIFYHSFLIHFIRIYLLKLKVVYPSLSLGLDTTS